MKLSVLTSAALVLPAACLGDPQQHQHVFQASKDGDVSHQTTGHHRLPRPRIAIIGGGAAGTSSAFFLSHLGYENHSLAVDVDLFEANDYLGGRSTIVYPFDNDTYPSIEVGASIFVKANKNLWKASKLFNLTLQDMHGGGDDETTSGMAIFDGQDFVYRESSGGYGWWNMAKLFWRYGYSGPMTVKNTVSETVARFTQLYGDTFQSNGPYESILEFAEALDLDRLAYNTTKEHLKSLGVNELFIQELVAAATRVNYGQNPSQLQAFEGMVSMAANGASSIKGGNRQLFEHFAANSNARLHLNTRVMSIEKLDSTSTSASSNGVIDPTARPWLIRYEDVDSTRTSLQLFDAIIYATPMHPTLSSYATPVQFINSNIPSQVPKVNYVHLYVTLLVTNATIPRPEFFSKKKDEIVPNTILSTFEAFENGKSKVKPRINSLNYLRNLGKISHETGNGHVVKIFSEYEMTESTLQELFGPKELLWVYQKDWPAYPISPPFKAIDYLASFKPDSDDPQSHFYYPNAFERWVSTMETETVAAWNSVALLVRDMFGFQVKKSWADWDVDKERD